MSMRLIDEVRLIVKFDETDQTEGVVAFLNVKGQWMPLMAADERRYRDIEDIATDMARQSGDTYKVISLTTRTEIGEITP